MQRAFAGTYRQAKLEKNYILLHREYQLLREHLGNLHDHFRIRAPDD